MPGDGKQSLEDVLEARVARDEERLAADERFDQTNRALALIAGALGLVLTIAIAGLIVGLVALRHDVRAIGSTAPPGSVNSGSIQDGAVTSDKLAAAAVTASALAPASVTHGKIGRGAIDGSQIRSDAITSPKVAFDSLDGSDILESTLLGVRSAQWAKRSGRFEAMRAATSASAMSRATVKGPLTATCPRGTRAISGGVSIAGAARGVSIWRSAPSGRSGWSAAASAHAGHGDWQLVVTVLCA